jgi:hypothetical protein
MKIFYIALTVKQNKNYTVFTDQESTAYNPGYYAYIIKCTESDNLCSVLGRVGGLLHANICPTKKRAAEIVTTWNNNYKENGTYLFDTPAF